MANKISSVEDFEKVHGILLAASGLPQKLYARLFHKLASDTLDGGAHFQIEPCDDGRRRRLVLTSESMPKESDVFLIDHAWTFRLPDAYKQVGPWLLHTDDSFQESKYKVLQGVLSNDMFLVYRLRFKMRNFCLFLQKKKFANSFL